MRTKRKIQKLKIIVEIVFYVEILSFFNVIWPFSFLIGKGIILENEFLQLFVFGLHDLYLVLF